MAWYRNSDWNYERILVGKSAFVTTYNVPLVTAECERFGDNCSVIFPFCV